MKLQEIIRVPATNKPSHLHGAFKKGYLAYLIGSKCPYGYGREYMNNGPFRKAFYEGKERAEEDFNNKDVCLVWGEE